MHLKKSFFTIGLFTALSRVCGLGRDVLMAAFLGVSTLAEVFFVAFKLPNFFRKLFAEGAFSSSFVPIYAEQLADNKQQTDENRLKNNREENKHHIKHGVKHRVKHNFQYSFQHRAKNIAITTGKADDFANKSFSLLAYFLAIFCCFAIIFMPYIIHIIAYGFIADATSNSITGDNEAGKSSEKILLTIELARITFFYLFFISLTSLLSGMLNSHNHFATPAFAPILLNICMIFALLVGHYTSFFSSIAHSLAYSVLLAGLLQFCLCYLVCLRLGIHPVLINPIFISPLRQILRDAKIRLLLRRMLPGIIGAGVTQINLLIDMVIATFFAGSLSYLYYGDRIFQLPLAMIGTAMGVAILPSLAKHLKQGEETQATKLKNKAIELAMFLSLPATIALMVIALPIISTLFERGKFTYQDAIATSYGLMAYAAGLPAFVMVKILVQGFFARGDTKKPVKIAIICLVANIVLSLGLLWVFLQSGLMPHIALAASTSLAAYLNCGLLYLHNKFAFDVALKNNIRKIIIASILMGAILWVVQQYIKQYMGLFASPKGSELQAIIMLMLMVIPALASYLLWGRKAVIL